MDIKKEYVDKSELTKQDLIKEISTYYSEEIEDFKLVEEFAEVVTELAKYKKGNAEPLKLANELADLLNVIEHIAFQKKLDMEHIHKVQQEKRVRQRRRIMIEKGEF